MSKLHAQVSLFGAIDEEVSKAKKRLTHATSPYDIRIDTAVVELVDTLLPGTAGFAQHGWFPELAKFLNRQGIVKSDVGFEFPQLTVAVNELRKLNVNRDERDPVLARATFAAVVLKKIYDLTQRGTTEDTDVLSILPSVLRSWSSDDPEALSAKFESKIAEITNRQSWMHHASAIIDSEFASRALPCNGTLRRVDDKYCAFITTDTTDHDVNMVDIAEIIDPINWSRCSSFFCEMKRQDEPFNIHGAARLYERISGQCEEYSISTALTFWKSEQPDGSIVINYDLDEMRDNDSGIVEVDSGYLWATPAVKLGRTTGVRIRTGKLERISGLSVTATAALAQLMGWGDQAHDMLIGTARMTSQALGVETPFEPLLLSPFDAARYRKMEDDI